jgi:CRISPR-associated endonuclease Csn1
MKKKLEPCVVSRVPLSDKFTEKYIQDNLVDKAISGVLIKHLNLPEYDGKADLAFSSEGLDALNRAIMKGVYAPISKPIKKVKVFEPLGMKFSLGTTGVKAKQFAEADKGTNLYFGAYKSQTGNLNFDSIPLQVAIQRLKQGDVPAPVSIYSSKGEEFRLENVYMPGDVFQIDHSEEKLERFFRLVSFTGNRAFFLPVNVAKPIAAGYEFSSINKIEVISVEGKKIPIKNLLQRRI